MTKDEILRYIFVCVCYKHNNDISPHITKSARKKENLLFKSAVEFLLKLDKEKIIFNKTKAEQFLKEADE